MAKKFVDNFGRPPRVRVAFTKQQSDDFVKYDWFIKPENDDTRNAVAQSLQLVDNEGDQIFYDGVVLHGFLVPFDHVSFLHKSASSGTWKFTSYRRRKNSRDPWAKWKGGAKTARENLKSLSHLFKQPGKNQTKK